MPNGRARIAVTAALWAVFATAPLAVDDWQLTQLAQLMTYGIFAMSLAFVWGQIGLLCFGQAIFFGIGGYAMAVVTKGMLPGVPGDTALGLVAAVVLPGIAAYVLGQFLFRGRGLSGAYFAIVTLSASVIAERAASHWTFIGGFNGLLNVPPLRVGWGGVSVDLVDPLPTYYAMLAVAAAVFAGLLWLDRSPLGTVFRGIRDNDERTAYFGYDVAAYKTFGFVLSGAVAGLAGALFVTQFGFVSPALIGFPLSTEVLIWVALGGKEVLLAAFMGAIVVRSVEGVLSETLGYYWLLALGVLFVLSVVLLPRGLLGWWLRLPMPARLTRRAEDRRPVEVVNTSRGRPTGRR
ncbi:MAG TPA: branched-chain amino acid ABC transporter permease [Dongiaceae bacterium]|nr:branched-chain amino acid ABC transporter permease [Dongiaceae bacterium]